MLPPAENQHRIQQYQGHIWYQTSSKYGKGLLYNTYGLINKVSDLLVQGQQ